MRDQEFGPIDSSPGLAAGERRHRRPPTPGRPSDAQWLSLPRAAAFLDLSPDALRRTLERRAGRTPDGGVEATFDGVRGRKLGRLWRVQLSGRWLAGASP
jgi:hypothetical protein